MTSLLKNTVAEIKVPLLKRKARDAYLSFYRIMDEYDCGHEMLKQFSVRASEAAEKFNEAMKELELIDPSCPKGKRL